MTSLARLAELTGGVRTCRWSSFDPTGGNGDRWVVPAGGTVTLGEADGPGCIRHIWMATHERDNNLKAMVLRMYWDGEATPSVLCPLGDFFGLGHAKGCYLNAAPIQVAYLGMNSWFPMPFATGARITVTNDGPQDSFVYFYVDHERFEGPPQGQGRFHAMWCRELVWPDQQDFEKGINSAGKPDHLNRTGKANYTVLDVEGRGHYVGCFLHLDTNRPGWWGEGDDMFFIDGDRWPPTLHGTGTEDYFCGAWNYNHLERTFCTPYFGYYFRGNADYTGKHSQYRFHVVDPVRFERSLRFSIEHGHANDRAGDWSSVAFWYQADRCSPLPDCGAFEDRIPFAYGGLERWPGKNRADLPA